MQTLHAALTAAGVPLDSHESDLYAPDTALVRAILAGYPLELSTVTTFHSRGQRWLCIPFAFLPWWQARAGLSISVSK